MSLSGRCILVVEDEWLIRAVAVEHFCDSGYRVLEAGNGEEAAAIFAQAQAVDAIFTDIRLGGVLTGWDIAEMFRARGPKLAVIYASGDTGSGPPRNVSDSRFFHKPYDMGDIVQAFYLLGCSPQS